MTANGRRTGAPTGSWRRSQPSSTRRFSSERLHGLVRRSAQGTLGVGFVTGERGIGKSSLAALVRHRAEHDSNWVGCHVYLGGVDDVPEMLRRTFHRLLNESIDKPWHQQLTSFLGNRIKSAGLFGLTLDLSLTRNDLAGGLRILQR
ncbi:MAG: ATP-binding protein [Gammaproteobacteria bacterium]|nr:ATP-binding protein [Gammaproteobacteria bacterium]